MYISTPRACVFPSENLLVSTGVATYLVLAEKLLEDLHCTRVDLVDVSKVED